MLVLWLVNQLWVIVTVNPRKNRASSELYKSNRLQVSMGYRLINHFYEFFSCSTNSPRDLSAYNPQKLVVYCLSRLIIYVNVC